MDTALPDLIVGKSNVVLHKLVNCISFNPRA
jgi:hypothetical protein